MTFLEFARAHGLIVDHIPADGAWHRFKTETHPHKRCTAQQGLIL